MSDFDNEKIQSYLKQGACVLDVRSEEEYEAGHVPESMHVPLDVLPHNLEKIKRLKKSVIAVCRSGNRSGTATDFLNQMGVDTINGGPWENVSQYVI